MKIKEIEERTGVSANTLRYYEEEGLIEPRRNSTNSYREYTNEDVELVKKIKFLRNLQFPVKVIAGIFDGTITFEAAVESTLSDLKGKKEELEFSIHLLELLSKEGEATSEVYTNEVFDFYKRHPFIQFCDNISNALSRHLPLLRMGFLPEEGINSKEDFIFELIQYAQKEDKKLEILDNSMMPNIRLNDVPMQAVLVPWRQALNYRIVKFKVLKV